MHRTLNQTKVDDISECLNKLERVPVWCSDGETGLSLEYRCPRGRREKGGQDEGSQHDLIQKLHKTNGAQISAACRFPPLPTKHNVHDDTAAMLSLASKGCVFSFRAASPFSKQTTHTLLTDAADLAASLKQYRLNANMMSRVQRH